MHKDLSNNPLIKNPEMAMPEQGHAKFWRKTGILTIKWIVILFSGWYLYKYVIIDTRFSQLLCLTFSITRNLSSLWLLVAGIALVVANWGIETLKWQYLIKKFARLSFFRALAAVLSGNSISLWMPNRVGEYLGRVIFLDPKVRIKSIFATVIGGISQLAVTLILGIAGAVFYEKNLGQPVYIQVGIACAGLIFIAAILFFYFNIRVLRSLIPALKWTRKLRKYLKVYRLFSRAELRRTLVYSLARYAVFCMQFYLLLLFFGVSIPFFRAIMLIFLMYFLQTLSPTAGITELVVRGGTTVLIFTSYTNQLPAVLAASYGIWLINLLFPAMIGALIFGFASLAKKTKA